MKISYTVDIGERFKPPAWRLAPSNYDSNKHIVKLELSTGNTCESQGDWAKSCTYFLELKKVRTSRFFAYASNGGTIYGNSLTQAWNWTWTKGKTTKFVVEHIYENDILIDMIVHKDPKG